LELGLGEGNTVRRATFSVDGTVYNRVRRTTVILASRDGIEYGAVVARWLQCAASLEWGGGVGGVVTECKVR
jgi:hypothetical protein